MDKVYKFHDGINSKDFAKISRLLREGSAINFNCGAGQYGRSPATVPDSFKKHVEKWVDYIEDHYNSTYKEKVKLRFDYFAPDEWMRVLVYSPFVAGNNRGAKHLLGKDYMEV
jgi:hypothetical protein